MPREYNIKWRETDEEKLRRAVRNYNAKISRLEKDPEYGFDKHLLPRRASVKDLREQIGTRKDFNKQIDRLQSFSQRGGEYRLNWREPDEKKITAAVRKFNAQITQLEKEMGEREKAALPERASVKQLKRIIGTRADLQKEIKALERFSKPGAEEIVIVPGNDYNLKTTKWQKEEMERRLFGINERRAEKREKIAGLDMTSRGKAQGYKRGQVGNDKVSDHALDPIVAFTPKQNRADLNMKFRQILRESQSDYWDRRDEVLRKNYIKGIEENFKAADVANVVSIIENMDFSEFRKIFEAEGGNFEPLYPPRDDEEYQGYLSALKATWDPQK